MFRVLSIGEEKPREGVLTPAFATMFFLCVFICAAPLASADQAGFSLRVKDELRVAEVPIIQKQGVAYVSLPELVRQVGGGCMVTPEKAQVDLVAKTAALRLNSSEVNSSLGNFILSHPVLESGNDALIALSDVAPLFDKAFFLDMRPDGKMTPANTKAVPSEPSSSTLLVQEPLPAEPVSNTVTPLAQTPAQPASNTVSPLDQPPPQPTSAAVSALGQTPVAPASSTVAEPAVAEPASTTAIPPALEQNPKQPQTPAQERLLDRPIKVVVIDPGHGGGDAGIKGPAGAQENALNLAVALKAQKAIQALGGGLQVVLTRDKDLDLTRRERSIIAESSNGDLLISIHCGGSLSPTATGFEVFCCVAPGPGDSEPSGGLRASDAYASRSRAVAESITSSLADAMGQKNDGVHTAPCAVLSEAHMCGVLIETGCLTNSADEALLSSDAQQDKIAQGIAAGIAAFLAPKENAGAGKEQQ
jgi:N-acetylmuramoyl-L-alanine amidase